MSGSGLSPMMRHYLEIKDKYKDCVVFYRLGDFYEMFFDDALEVSQLLDLTLTGRDCGLEERAPMCGIPYHAADTYIAKLVALGKKVAICEQLSDPKETKGIVERDVIRVVSSGTLIEDELLDEKRNNYIACCFKEKENLGLAWTDITTGEFCTAAFGGDKGLTEMMEYLVKLSPAEVITNEEFLLASKNSPAIRAGGLPSFSCYVPWAFGKSRAEKKAARKAWFAAVEYNRTIESSKIVMDEMNRFNTVEGQAQLEEARKAVEMGYDFIYNYDPQALARAKALPKGTEKEKAYRKAEIQRARDAAFARRTALRKFPNGIQEFDVSVFDGLFAREDELNAKIESLYSAYYAAKKEKNPRKVESLKAEIKAAKADKRVVEAEIKKAGDENALYTRAAKPYIDAKKLLTQAENYSRFEEIAAMYDDAKARHEEAMALAAAEAERKKQEEKAYAAELKAKRAAEKAQKKSQKKNKDK